MDTIVVGMDLAPLQMDPRLATDAAASKIKHLVFSGLLRLDDDLRLVPDIAASFAMTDASTVTFVLRDDVRFHDGRKLSSVDVKATYDSMMDPKLASPFAGGLALIDAILTPTPSEVVFKLKQPSVPFLTSATLGILEASQALAYREGEARAPDTLVGTGPYALVRGQDGFDEKVRLMRFDGYFRGAAKTKNIEIRIVQDNTLRAMELMKGRLDLVQNAIPYALVPAIRQSKDLKFNDAIGVNFNYLGFNFVNRYLKIKKVREAIAAAVDRDKIIRYKLKDLARPADSILSPEHWAHVAGLKPFAYDPEHAKKLLDEAGFPDSDGDGPVMRFDLVYKTSTNKERLEIVQLIADGLKRVGIGITVKSYEFGTLSRDIQQGDFDLFSMTWVGISDPDIYYSIAHSAQTPPKGANRGRYANATLDRLIEASRVETDSAKRLELLARIQKEFYEDLVYVPLWYDENFVATRAGISGYGLRPDASLFNLVDVVKTGDAK